MEDRNVMDEELRHSANAQALYRNTLIHNYGTLANPCLYGDAAHFLRVMLFNPRFYVVVISKLT